MSVTTPSDLYAALSALLVHCLLIVPATAHDFSVFGLLIDSFASMLSALSAMLLVDGFASLLVVSFDAVLPCCRWLLFFPSTQSKDHESALTSRCRFGHMKLRRAMEALSPGLQPTFRRATCWSAL